MSPEDFTNPNYNHPEIDTPLEVMPATDATKQALLDIITAKTINGYDLEKCFSATLVPNGSKETISISRFKERASKDNHSRMAGINIQETTENNRKIFTNIFINKSPDGLQIEKHTHSLEPMHSIGQTATQGEIGLAAAELIQSIEEMIDAEDTENELGLSFVSEAEARNVLALIAGSQPILKIDFDKL